MNKELNKILEFKEDADYKRLSYSEIKILKDYITNLQEENEEIKNTIDFIDNQYKNTINYNEKLIEYNKDYKSRIDKAIEYIKDDMYVEPKELYGLVDGEHLLNILTGGNEE